MVMRFDPFRELDRLSQDAYQTATRRATASVMPIDAYRSGDRFVVHFDLPGVDPQSVELTVEKNVLTVRAERGPSWTGDTELIVAARAAGCRVLDGGHMAVGQAAGAFRLEPETSRQPS